ncbi:hypothetical protein JQC92_21750 [Shewanella sp. 202IG2-18]|uniref:hypothetical protein n=1 Tax=Parashewanella hymeniacidonis TaxID=2807618 RepID=UPI0019611427|nr:hypothetical protein [Parashewanella hymeniacidonis]MBM7074606.1 hypothetical protein [Parashewanella hymeniacidonis]
MKSYLGKGYKDLKGTGSELRDNRDYDRLVEMVGEDGAKRAIRHKLYERNLTEHEWMTYRKVRSNLHCNPLKIREEIKEVNDMVEGLIDDE